MYKGQHIEGQTGRIRRYGGYLVLSFLLKLGYLRFGWTSDVVGRAECPYLRRHILWLGVFTLRLHKFLRSDNDRALHDHPWWFVTFPFRGYQEWRPSSVVRPIDIYKGRIVRSDPERELVLYRVPGWRFHFRPARYIHAVVIDKPTWTFVFSGPKIRTWGFWDDVRGFVPWREWFSSVPLPPCVDTE